MEAANVTKTRCVTKQAHIWQVLASTEQAVTLEGADRNVAVLAERGGKYCKSFFFFFGPERKINIPESITRIWEVFFPFHVHSSYVKQVQSDPWKKLVNA